MDASSSGGDAEEGGDPIWTEERAPRLCVLPFEMLMRPLNGNIAEWTT